MSDSIYAVCSGKRIQNRDAIEASLERELNFEYPNGYRHNKHRELVRTLTELNARSA